MDERWLIDTVPSTAFPVYTRLNANDVLADPVTPLGASLAFVPHMLPGWAAGYVALGAFTAPELTGEDVSPVAGFFYGHLYVNQTVVRVMGVRAGIGADAIDAAFFPHPDAPPHVPQPTDVNEDLSAAMAERTAWTLRTTTFPELEEEREIADAVRAQRPDLAALTPAALVARARSVLPWERLTWRGETWAGAQAAVGPGVIASLVGAVDPSLVVQLIGPAGDVDSAGPSYALWELSRAVRADPAVGAEFDAGPDRLVERLREHHPAFSQAFSAFLRDFGYRGPSEWDLGAEAWETNPGLALGLVDRLRHLDEDAGPAVRQAHQAAEAETAMARALDLLGEDAEARQTLFLAVASARRFGAWRERGKTSAVKVLHEARVALAELGRRLHAQGHLDSPQQVFMAVEGELDVLVASPAALRETLAERERGWRALFGLELPTFVTAGTPMPPLSSLPRRGDVAAERVTAGEVLQGAPAAAGVARGRARVVLDTSHVADFQPGEVLVAPRTDPSWTPLFLVSAAVVVDVGGLGSHAMIVSRELGIPCAAGVQQATRRIPNGALVEVDGSTGRVTVLEV